MSQWLLPRIFLGLSVLASTTISGVAHAGYDDCAFHFGAYTGEPDVIAKTTSADGNPEFRIYRNHQDIDNYLYGHERYSEMFAVPCDEGPNGNNVGTYWVAFSKTRNYLRLPPGEEAQYGNYCVAANNQPGVPDPSSGACRPLDNSAWIYFERRLQAEPGDSIAIHAHYPMPDAIGEPQDTDSYFGLTALEAVAGLANDFNANSTLQLDDIDIWVDNFDNQTTYLLTTVPAGTSADLSSLTGYDRYSEVRFTGHSGGPIAIRSVTPDMT